MNIPILKDRSLMMSRCRDFFAQRNVTEVDCPILSKEASVDEHIDLMATTSGYYLHSSPEYYMKRLLAEGSGDIYQLSHVFREGECGPCHNPEFTMAEWYRCGISYEKMIEETCNFIRLFVGNKPSVIFSYCEVFQKYIDPIKATVEELLSLLSQYNISIYETSDKDDLLMLFFSEVIEPTFDPNVLTVIKDYPASQAALAQIEGGYAKRFEVFCGGLELANGYKELTNVQEQRQRLIQSNEKRKKRGKKTLPLDENFLAALKKGLPECCGVAVGFDRLMMLRHKSNNILNII